MALIAGYSVDGIITVIMVIVLLGGLTTCGYRELSPNCSLTAEDQFNDFVEKFENCKSGSCERFSHSTIPSEHEIILESSGGVTSIKLLCNGRIKYTEIFEEVDICSYDLISQQKSGVLDEFEIKKFLNSPYNLYSLNGEIELVNVRDDVCFSSKRFSQPPGGSGISPPVQ